MGLAGESTNDPIHRATPSAALEGSQIVPNRTWAEESFFNRRNQDRDVVCFPFNVTDDATAWGNQLDTEFKTSASGAEGQNPGGT